MEVISHSKHTIQGKEFVLCKGEDNFWYSFTWPERKMFHATACEFKSKRAAMDYTRNRMRVLQNIAAKERSG
jgi:hypothetical protein